MSIKCFAIGDNDSGVTHADHSPPPPPPPAEPDWPVWPGGVPLRPDIPHQPSDACDVALGGKYR